MGRRIIGNKPYDTLFSTEQLKNRNLSQKEQQSIADWVAMKIRVAGGSARVMRAGKKRSVFLVMFNDEGVPKVKEIAEKACNTFI